MNQISSKENKVKVLTCVVLGCVGILGTLIIVSGWFVFQRKIGLLHLSLSRTTVTPAVLSREITHNSLPLSQRWRKQTYIPPLDEMVAKNPYLFVPGLGKSVVRSSLQAFDADTGILVWKIDDLPGINEISADDSSLYVAAQDHIQAYDLDDGSASWESETIPSKRIYAMEAENSALLVYSVEASFGYEEQVVRLIDPMNGAIDERLRIEVSSGRKLLCEDKEREFWLDTNRLLAYRKSDDDVLWQVTIEDPVNCIPVGPMGLAVLSERGWSTIHLINRISGEIEWISSQIIISNIAYSEGTIYAIQEDGSLIGVDFNTGKEIGKIMLALPRNVGDTMSETYQVSMYKSKLFAYWGDSQDLIAFDILKK